MILPTTPLTAEEVDEIQREWNRAYGARGLGHWAKEYGGVLIESYHHQAALLKEAEMAIEMERLNYEGALSDIDSLITAFYRRIRGEADMVSGFEWLMLNYPKQTRSLAKLTAPTPEKE